MDGDILRVDLYVETDNAVTVPSGWTQMALAEANVAGDDYRHYAYWKRASGEGASWTWSWTGSTGRSARAVAYLGARASGDPWSFIDSQVRDTTAAATYPAVSGTTLDADELLTWCGGMYQNPSAHTPPTSFTEIEDTSGDTLYLTEKAQATAGATGSITGASYTGTNGPTTVILAGLRPVATTQSDHSASYPNRTRESEIRIPL